MSSEVSPFEIALEIAPNLPDAPGVRAMLEVLSGSSFAGELSVGKVCGNRVSAVWLGASLEVVSVTLEAAELSDAGIAHARAVDFIAELERKHEDHRLE